MSVFKRIITQKSMKIFITLVLFCIFVYHVDASLVYSKKISISGVNNNNVPINVNNLKINMKSSNKEETFSLNESLAAKMESSLNLPPEHAAKVAKWAAMAKVSQTKSFSLQYLDNKLTFSAFDIYCKRVSDDKVYVKMSKLSASTTVNPLVRVTITKQKKKRIMGIKTSTKTWTETQYHSRGLTQDEINRIVAHMKSKMLSDPTYANIAKIAFGK